MKVGEYNIVATFRYGRVWGNVSFSFMSIVACAITFGFTCFGFIMWSKNLAASLFTFFVDLFFVGLFIAEFVKAIRNRRYVRKCLKDGVEKTVVAKFFDEDSGLGLHYKGVKIAVSLHHQNKKIKQHSVYDRVFKSYVGEKVTVLYSSTYNEVLLCKKEEAL